jgi:hypothetical protein
MYLLAACSHHLFLQDKEVGCDVSRSTDGWPEHRRWQCRCAADLQQQWRLQTADLQLWRRRFSWAGDDNLVREQQKMHAAVALASARLLFSEGVRLILFMQCLLEEFDEEMEDRSDDW